MHFYLIQFTASYWWHRWPWKCWMSGGQPHWIGNRTFSRSRLAANDKKLTAALDAPSWIKRLLWDLKREEKEKNSAAMSTLRQPVWASDLQLREDLSGVNKSIPVETRLYLDRKLSLRWLATSTSALIHRHLTHKLLFHTRIISLGPLILLEICPAAAFNYLDGNHPKID